MDTCSLCHLINILDPPSPHPFRGKVECSRHGNSMREQEGGLNRWSTESEGDVESRLEKWQDKETAPAPKCWFPGALASLCSFSACAPASTSQIHDRSNLDCGQDHGMKSGKLLHHHAAVWFPFQRYFKKTKQKTSNKESKPSLLTTAL